MAGIVPDHGDPGSATPPAGGQPETGGEVLIDHRPAIESAYAVGAEELPFHER
jgi:hypothetical protein